MDAISQADATNSFITGRRQPELNATVRAVGGGAIGVRGDVSNLADLDLALRRGTPESPRHRHPVR
jgi:hypothetical protein